MKKIAAICIPLVTLFMLAGCDLTEQPEGFVSESNFYRSASDAKASVIGAYQAAAVAPGIQHLNLLNTAGCIGTTQDSRYTYLLTGDADADGVFLEGSWDGQYEAVRKANTTIQKVSGMSAEATDITAEQKALIVAEAKFLRALNYFGLVRIWGPVPLRLPSDPAGTNLPPAPIEEVYAQIAEDLESAIPDLGVKGDYEPGRATRSAAQALLAKVYLTTASTAKCAANGWGEGGCAPYSVFEGDIDDHYQQAKSLAGEVLTGSGYRLLEDYSAVWGEGSAINDEMIYQHMQLPETMETSWALAVRYTPPWSKYARWGGQYGGLTYEFVRSYDTTDVRFADNLIWEYEHIQEEGRIVEWSRDIDDPDRIVSDGPYWIMANKKYADETSTTWRGGANIPVLRMSEVYLIYAEAENELNGPTADALASVNAVRERAQLPPYGDTTQEDLRSAILDERGWELALEGKDWYDYKRTGTLQERCYDLSLDVRGQDNEPHPRARQAEDYRFPYPESEVVTNPNISNPNEPTS